MKQVLIRAIISEKSMQLAQTGWYTFAVEPKSNKREIAEEVNQQFKVHVTAVRSLNVKGSLRRGRKGNYMQEGNWKKALVKLKAKEKIDLFESNPTAGK